MTHFIHISRKISHILFFSFILLFSGCNNDIFIENEELPDNLWIPLKADGDQWSSTFSRKGLERVYISNGLNMQEYLKYYDQDGREIGPDSSPDKLSEIIFENPAQSYIIGFKGGMIYFTSNYNTYPSASVVDLDFQYNYGVTKQIHFTISPGYPLESVEIYNDDIIIEENIDAITYSGSFTNNSNLTQNWKVFPYSSLHCNCLVEPADNWAKDIEVKMSLPLYAHENWDLYNFEEITLGERISLVSPMSDSECIDIEIPPGKKAIIAVTVNYSKATKSGVFYFLNRVSELSTTENFICTAICPTSYEYTLNYE